MSAVYHRIYKVLKQLQSVVVYYVFCNDTADTEIYTLSLHDALPIYEIVVPKYDFYYNVPDYCHL